MGSKGSATTTSTSAPPQAVQDMYKYLTEQGKALQQQPYQAYTGELVPNINATQQAGINQAQQYSQAAQPYLQQAGQMTQQAAMGYNPQNYAQGVAGYMNPYMQQAMGATAAQLQNVNQQQQQQLLGDTISKGAFGGDRGQIAQAALMNQQNLATGNVLANMANTGYNAAAANYMAGLGAQGQLGAQYGNIGNLAQTAGMTGAQQLSTAGAIPYAVQQAQDAAKYQQFAQQQAYPFQTLGSLANIASGLGAGQGGTSTSTAPGPNSMSQILGLGTAFLNMSDERTKENVEPIGKSFDGQNIYKFNYKGDPKTNIGLMAQEVEKHNPSAVHRTEGGLRMVDYDAATSHAADRGHFADGGSSMGGLVPESMDRKPYATYGRVGKSQAQFGTTPFIDSPLFAAMVQKAGLDLGSYIPDIEVSGPGGGMALPHATPYEDQPLDTSAITGFSKSLYNKLNTPSLTSVQIAGQYGRGDNINSSAEPVWHYSENRGGVVPRSQHADGDQTPTDQNKTVPANSDFLGNLGSSISKGVGGLFSTNDQPGLIGNLFNGGKPLPEDIRNAIIAGGFATAASRSPFALSAIGEGGLGAMNYLSSQKKLDYERQKALAEQALKGREIDVSSRLADIQELSVGTQAFEHIKQLYEVKQDSSGQMHIYGLGGQEVPLDQYRQEMASAAARLHIPVDDLIRRHIQEQNMSTAPALRPGGFTPIPHNLGGRTAHAFGGVPGDFNNPSMGGLLGNDKNLTSFDQQAPIAPVSEVQPIDEMSDVKRMARSILRPTDIANPDMAAPKIQMAQAAPATTTDGTTGVSSAEKLHPTLQRIMDFQKKSEQLYKEADSIDQPGGQLDKALMLSPENKKALIDKANNKRAQALSYENQANALQNQEYTDENGVKFRWEYGAESPESMPPKEIDEKTPRGKIDQNTGRFITAPVDLGYPNTGGIPISKLGKHQVRIGDDPTFVSTLKSSIDNENEFNSKAQNTQEGIVNTIKFASALKVLESGALTSDATGLAALAKAIGAGDIVQNTLALGKPISEAETALKTQLYSSIAQAGTSFAKPTQLEWSKIESKGSPSVDSQPNTAHSLAATNLAAFLWQNALERDWQRDKVQKRYKNFDGYVNTWKQVNDRADFEKVANRLLGNFKGQPLPSDDELVEGGVYVVPMPKKGQPADAVTQRAYNLGLTGGDIYSVEGVKHYKDENGVDRVSVAHTNKLSPNEVYGAMLSQPGFSYGAR